MLVNKAPQVALYSRAQVVHQGHLLEVDGVADVDLVGLVLELQLPGQDVMGSLLVVDQRRPPSRRGTSSPFLCAPRTACRARTRRRPAPCGRRCRPRCGASSSRGRACGPRHSPSRGRCRLCTSRRFRRASEDDSVLVAVHGGEEARRYSQAVWWLMRRISARVDWLHQIGQSKEGHKGRKGDMRDPKHPGTSPTSSRGLGALIEGSCLDDVARVRMWPKVACPARLHRP